MRCLVDTNIFLEVLLNQKNATQARTFLRKSDIHELYVSDFSLHSIILILLRHKAFDLTLRFITDTIHSGSVSVLALPPAELTEVIAAARQHGFDFDDAYQYVLAGRHDLIIVSFDSDFDRTPNGRRLPETI